MIYSLYVKQHNQTGLKYLGKTKSNPDTYKGSGTYWKRHIKNNGNDVSTYIVGTYETEKDLREAGIYFSKVWNIIDSKEWANLTTEEGQGGWSHVHNEENYKKTSLTKTGKPKSLEHRQKIGLSHLGKYTEKQKQNRSNTNGKNNGMYGKKHSIETKEKMRQARLSYWEGLHY